MSSSQHTVRSEGKILVHLCPVYIASSSLATSQSVCEATDTIIDMIMIRPIDRKPRRLLTFWPHAFTEPVHYRAQRFLWFLYGSRILPLYTEASVVIPYCVYVTGYVIARMYIHAVFPVWHTCIICIHNHAMHSIFILTIASLENCRQHIAVSLFLELISAVYSATNTVAVQNNNMASSCLLVWVWQITQVCMMWG